MWQKRHQNHIRDVVLVSLWVTFTHCSGVSIVDFEQANAGWISFNKLYHNYLSQLLKGLEFKLHKLTLNLAAKLSLRGPTWSLGYEILELTEVAVHRRSMQ